MYGESLEIIPKVWCDAKFSEDMEMSYRHFSWQAPYFERVGDVEVEFSWQAQGIVRLRRLVEVNVAVPLGLACERVLFGGAGIAKLLGNTLRICRPSQNAELGQARPKSLSCPADCCCCLQGRGCTPAHRSIRPLTWQKARSPDWAAS